MEFETKRKIELTVTGILKSVDMDSVTELKVRDMAAHKLGIDLSDLEYKILVRHVIESFLLSLDDDIDVGGSTKDGDELVGDFPTTAINGARQVVEEEEEDTKPIIAPVATQGADDWCRVICKLSNKRDVAIRSFGGETVLSIGELFWKDGKQIPSPKCMSLSNDQWSIFRKSIPAIEEAIIEVESRLRSELERKQANDKRDRCELESKQSRRRLLATGKQVENLSPLASTSEELIPIEIIRLDGKSYQQWADKMETYLKRLKVAYVLSEPRPSAVGVIDSELSQTLSAAEKWINDDHICRQNILNSLCDNLFGYYSKKPGTAKDLWEELKLTYIYERHGVKVSLVKKYIEFQMVEEKSVFEQVQEFHKIADSLNASGMYIEEKFHVNVIISKLPPSWKPYSIELMKEDYLPVWMLMNDLKAEEDSHRNGNKAEAFPPPRADGPVFQPNKKLGAQRVPMKRPGVSLGNHETDREGKVKFCTICKKKGHVLEQCWFRPGGKYSTNEGKDTSNGKVNVLSTNVVAGKNTDGIVE